VPGGNVAVHVPVEQLIPDGLLVTVPDAVTVDPGADAIVTLKV
jgi:hypothetical protein